MIKGMLCILLAVFQSTLAQEIVLTSDFSSSSEGFTYADDLFRATNAGAYASGSYDTTSGSSGDGALEVTLGGINDGDILGMSGGWQRSFQLAQTGSVMIGLAFQLEASSGYENDEYSQILCSLDGNLIGVGGNDYVAQIFGNGNGGASEFVGYQTVMLQAGQLSAGSHTIAVGGYNNKKTLSDEVTWIRIDRVEITLDAVPVSQPTPPPIPPPTPSPASGASTVVLQSTFASSTEQFVYLDDIFRATNAPGYASGSYETTSGRSGDGALEVRLGGINNDDILGMSGGWQRGFQLAQTGSVAIKLAFQLEASSEYENDEYSQVLCSLDGNLIGTGGNDYVAQIFGNGNGGASQFVGYQTVTLQASQLSAGSHTIAVGGYNNKKTLSDEVTWIRIDSVEVSTISTATAAPVSAPTVSPTFAPTSMPNEVPTTSAPVITSEDLLINCGGEEYTDIQGRLWLADDWFVGGTIFTDARRPIAGTQDDEIYTTERYGEASWEIPLGIASYEVSLHLAEIFWDQVGKRKFNVEIEGTVFTNLDIVEIAGSANTPITIDTAAIVEDGFLSITLTNAIPKVNNPKLSGIEIKLLEPHLAHAVAGGPYTSVDVDNDGFGVVSVDASSSHTHATGKTLVDWTWREGTEILGWGETESLSLPVGIHTVSLTVVDDGGNDSTEDVLITVKPFGFPSVSSLNPSTGSIAGGKPVIISGSGFTYPASETIVRFGQYELTGSEIEIVDQFTINVITPPETVGVPVAVSVVTPLSESNSETFIYIAASEIAFTSAVLQDYPSCTAVGFGPDGKLYVGNLNGDLARLTLSEDFTSVVDSVVSNVAANRAILGITFDPIQTGPFPKTYISSNGFFHGESNSSSGQAINGDIRMVTGANLDTITTVITGLPVSDSDHGLNGLEHGNEGELYILAGSNTNGGIPGQLTGQQIQKDNYYSSAVIKASLADPLFDGTITYDADDDGTPNGGNGIEVFAAGFRNPYGMVLHSNGKAYATDNGPNKGYGDMLQSCSGQFIPDVEEEDKLCRLSQGGYYGAPNLKRALVDNDPRQCKWRSQNEPSDSDLTAPILIMKSSTDGLIEFQGDHFDKQLKGNLLAAKYKKELYRVVLTPDGEGVIAQSNPAIPLVGDYNTLDLTQAPDGTLISCSLNRNALHYHRPNEDPTSVLQVKTVFPRRGGQAGGNKLDVFGVNFGAGATVTVGGSPCIVTTATDTKIQCTAPGGTPGLVAVVVTLGAETYVYQNRYRYITGLPQQ